MTATLLGAPVAPPTTTLPTSAPQPLESRGKFIRTCPVLGKERSDDEKLGKGRCSATWVSQESCPKSCPFFNKGCYAQYNRAGWVTASLNAVGTFTALALAKMEAVAIRALSGKRDLRLHIVGDCRTDNAARTVAEACVEYMARYGKRVWTYTHAWTGRRGVKRESWGPVSVLASCQSVTEARDAMDNHGYAAALVVDKFEQDTSYPITFDMVGIPCPHMTGRLQKNDPNKGCVDCGLCMNADLLHKKRLVILFEVHGSGKKKAKEALKG